MKNDNLQKRELLNNDILNSDKSLYDILDQFD